MLTFNLDSIPKSDLKSLMAREDVDLSEAVESARKIIQDVRARGDSAVREYAAMYDGFRGSSLQVSERALTSAEERVPKKLLDALNASKKRIEKFHSRQKISAFSYADACGVVGQKVIPLDRVGVYVPGGTANYASTVLMACVPARLARVQDITVCTPAKEGRVSDTILAAARLCGVTRVFAVGGAQSIAAMAYGTETIPKVQKIVGPGGAFVSAAKLLVRNDCEIDFLAGPTEILVIADASAEPSLVAAEMLAQLEHDPMARALLVSPSEVLLRRTRNELEKQIADAARRDVVRAASERGAIFLKAKEISQAIEFSNEYAPEHLLVDVVNPAEVLGKIRSAGSVFLGRYSSVAFGDYCSGTNHILPTKGVAAMKSALSVYDFLKIIPYQSISSKGAIALSEIVEQVALSEGLPGHARTACARARRPKE
jgi:histidinol dehydrogenase